MAEAINFDEEDNGMPTGPAYDQAVQELEEIEPGPADLLNFNEDSTPTQTGEDPIHDLLGRSNGD